MIKISEISFFKLLRGIQSLSDNTVVILAPCKDKLETQGVSLLNLSFLKFISFDCSFLVSLPDKLADEIYLVLFRGFTVSSV